MPFIVPQGGTPVSTVTEETLAQAQQWYNQLRENLLPQNSTVARDLNTPEGRQALMMYEYDPKVSANVPVQVFPEGGEIDAHAMLGLYTRAQAGQLFIHGMGEERPYQLQTSGEAHQVDPAVDFVKPSGFVRWIKGVLNTISGGRWFADDMAEYARQDSFVENEKAAFTKLMDQMKNPNVEAETPMKNAFDAARRLAVLDNFQFTSDPNRFQKAVDNILKDQGAQKPEQEPIQEKPIQEKPIQEKPIQEPIKESVQQPQNAAPQENIEAPQGLTQDRIANNIDAFLAQQGGVAPEIGDVDTTVYAGNRPRLEEMKFQEIQGLNLSQHDTAILALAACFSSDVMLKTAIKNPEHANNPQAPRMITVEKANDPKTSMDRVLDDLLITQAPQSYAKAGPIMKAARRYVNSALNEAAAGNYEKLGKLVADGIKNTNELLADPNMNLGHKFAAMAGMGGELCALVNGNAQLKAAAEAAGLKPEDMEKMAGANALGQAWSRCKNSQESLTANFLKGTLPNDYKEHVAATAQMYSLEAQCKQDPSMKFNNVYKDNPGMNEATIQKMVDTSAIRGFGSGYGHDTSKMATALNDHSVMAKNGTYALDEIAEKDIKAKEKADELSKLKDDPNKVKDDPGKGGQVPQMG